MTRPLVYTQKSVAFPTLPAYDRELDDINVSGPQSSIKFAWVALSSFEGGALKVEAFSDSFATLLDPRIVRIVAKAQRARRRNKDVSPGLLIKWLEEEGAIPSSYHLQHVDNGNLTDKQREELAQRIELARSYE